MGVQSLSSKGPNKGKYFQAVSGSTAAVSKNTTQTLLNITGKGILSRLSAILCDAYTRTPNQNGYLRIIVTVDGTSFTIVPNGNEASGLGSVFASYNSGGSPSTYTGRRYAVDLLPNISFDSSLKIEVSHTYPTDNYPNYTDYHIDYALC